jgi:hypothetical protein
MDTSDHDETKRQPARRSYQAPRIQESGAFERLALACGHKPGEPLAACTPGRRTMGTPSS